jgi:predicted amidophosphoribosyltransferase
LLKRYLKHHHIGLTPLLKKSSYENAQANRSGEERRNAKDLQFEIIRPIPSGTHVWIFDDVITTGATLKSACHQLKWAGAQTVTTLSFAKSSWEPFSLPTTKAPSIIDS